MNAADMEEVKKAISSAINDLKFKGWGLEDRLKKIEDRIEGLENSVKELEE